MIVGANMPWQSIDTESGLIAPWFTAPCLEWLKKQDISRWVIFEFGCGYSTIWFRLNAGQVMSVDNNEKWARAMNAHFTNDRDEYIFSAMKLYMSSSLGGRMYYDCIIIDGAWRMECLQNAHGCVTPGGYIIIDNWGQEDFPNTKEAEELLVLWEKQLFKQPNHSRWITAVFRKP